MNCIGTAILLVNLTPGFWSLDDLKLIPIVQNNCSKKYKQCVYKITKTDLNEFQVLCGKRENK